MKQKKQLLGARGTEQAICRLAAKIARAFPGLEDVVLVGILTRGFPLAQRIAAKLLKTTGVTVAVGVLDSSLYRDDLRVRPFLRRTDLPSIDDKIVILVDDTLHTGRTIFAAMRSLADHTKRLRRIVVAVLVNRKEADQPELPISVQFVGGNFWTTADEHVNVRLVEPDGADEVWLMESEVRRTSAVICRGLRHF